VSASRPSIDLVVVSYHSTPDLHRFMHSAAAYAPKDARVVISLVEATAAEVADAGRLGASLVLSDSGNIGYNRACNRAARLLAERGGAPNIAFLNADTELRPGTVEGCIRHLEDETVAVVGPRQVDHSGRITHAGIVGHHAAPRHRGWLERPRPGRAMPYSDVLDCVSVSGSAFFMNRDAFDELATCPTFKKFDPEAEGAFLTTFGYWGETWIAYHAFAHDYKVRYVGDVPEMVHGWHRASPVGGPHDPTEAEAVRVRTELDRFDNEVQKEVVG